MEMYGSLIIGLRYDNAALVPKLSTLRFCKFNEAGETPKILPFLLLHMICYHNEVVKFAFDFEISPKTIDFGFQNPLKIG